MAKRITLRNWKCDIIPDVQEYLLEMCDLSVLEKDMFSSNQRTQFKDCFVNYVCIK